MAETLYDLYGMRVPFPRGCQEIGRSSRYHRINFNIHTSCLFWMALREALNGLVFDTWPELRPAGGPAMMGAGLMGGRQAGCGRLL